MRFQMIQRWNGTWIRNLSSSQSWRSKSILFLHFMHQPWNLDVFWPNHKWFFAEFRPQIWFLQTRLCKDTFCWDRISWPRWQNIFWLCWLLHGTYFSLLFLMTFQKRIVDCRPIWYWLARPLIVKLCLSWKDTFIHELGSDLEIVENDRFINSTFWNWSKFDGDFSNDTEISFMAQNEFMDIRAWTDSWRFLLSLEGTDRGGNFNADNDIVNVTVSVLFHTWGSGTDPSSERGELNWVGLVAANNSELGEFFLHVLADNTGFDTGHHVIFIDPLDFIHSGTVDWNNGSFFTFLAHETFSDVCSSELRIKITLQKESIRRCVPWPLRLKIRPVRDRWCKWRNRRFWAVWSGEDNTALALSVHESGRFGSFCWWRFRRHCPWRIQWIEGVRLEDLRGFTFALMKWRWYRGQWQIQPIPWIWAFFGLRRHTYCLRYGQIHHHWGQIQCPWIPIHYFWTTVLYFWCFRVPWWAVFKVELEDDWVFAFRYYIIDKQKTTKLSMNVAILMTRW